MTDAVWEALLRHIPVEQQNQFMLFTKAGTEISIQSFLRFEPSLVVVKGRLAGSQDAGRIFVIPFDNLDYIGTSQPMKDEDFNAIIANLVLPKSVEPPVSNSYSSPDIYLPAPAESQSVGTPSGAGRGSGPRPVVRSEVLERFRARSNGPASSPNLPRPGE